MKEDEVISNTDDGKGNKATLKYSDKRGKRLSPKESLAIIKGMVESYMKSTGSDSIMIVVGNNSSDDSITAYGQLTGGETLSLFQALTQSIA